MSNNGKLGERLFSQLMSAKGYSVEDVSGNDQYFAKDIDFIITNPTGTTRTFEVKWCEKIHSTGNLFLEIANPRSKQWSGQGWWKHCQADYLVYGDAVNRKFYIIPLLELRERVDTLTLRERSTRDNSVGLILPLTAIQDLYIEECV